MNKEQLEAPARVTAAVVVVADAEEIINFEADLGVTDRPWNAIDHAVSIVAGDVTRGWAGRPGADDWPADAKEYDRPGSAQVLLTVSVGDVREPFERNVSTTGSLTRAIINLVHLLDDDATGWARGARKRAGGW